MAGVPIPLSLIHPRWHLAGPVNAFPGWKPSWSGTDLPPGCPYMDAQKNATTNAYAQVFALRDQLNAEGKSRLDLHLTLQTTAAKNTAQQLAVAQARSARLPDPIAKPEWVQQKKLGDKAIRRGMASSLALIVRS